MKKEESSYNIDKTFNLVFEKIDNKVEKQVFYWSVSGVFAIIGIILSVFLTTLANKNQDYRDLLNEIIKIKVCLQEVKTEIKYLKNKE